MLRTTAALQCSKLFLVGMLELAVVLLLDDRRRRGYRRVGAFRSFVRSDGPT